MRLVIVESPYAGDRERNDRYLRACLLDCLRRGEAPFASHAIYPLVLDDAKPEERRLGMDAGFAWRLPAAATVVYSDLGVSTGMAAGIRHSHENNVPIEFRNLGGEWS